MDLLNELNDEYDDEPIRLMEALSEAVGTMGAGKRGGVIRSKIQGAAGFMKKHPSVAISASILALNAYTKYKANQRNTIRLFAKDAYEKKMMTDVVKTMTQTGKYKVGKTKYADGGKYWVIVKV